MPESVNFSKLKEKVAANLVDVRQKVLVISGKGGVGKTSMSVNLSVALADAGRKICLLDTDIHGPNVPRLLHLQDRMPEFEGNRIYPVPFGENMGVVSPAFMQGMPGTPFIWRGPMKAAVIRQLLLDVVWGNLDFLVIDSPPGTGDEPLTVAQMIPPPVSALLVVTPQEVAIDDLRRAAAFCQRLEIPIAGLLENMSGMLCPHCGEQINLYKKGSGKSLSAELGIPFLGEVPFDPDMVIASDKGVPYVREFAEKPASRVILNVAAELSSPNEC